MTVKELIKLLSELADDSLDVCMYSDPEGNSLSPISDDVYADNDDDGNQIYILSPLY